MPPVLRTQPLLLPYRAFIRPRQRPLLFRFPCIKIWKRDMLEQLEEVAANEREMKATRDLEEKRRDLEDWRARRREQLERLIEVRVCTVTGFCKSGHDLNRVGWHPVEKTPTPSSQPYPFLSNHGITVVRIRKKKRKKRLLHAVVSSWKSCCLHREATTVVSCQVRLSGMYVRIVTSILLS